jgi:hypothetical protein
LKQHRIDTFEEDQAWEKGDRNSFNNTMMTMPMLGKAPKVSDLEAILASTSCNIVRKPQQLCVFVNKKDKNVLSVEECDVMHHHHPNHATAIDRRTEFPLWRSVYSERMEKSHSKIRNHDEQFLVISIVDAVVDDMIPMVEVFEVRVAALKSLQAIQGAAFKTSDVAWTKVQLVKIEKCLSPMLDLVENQLHEQEEFRNVRRHDILGSSDTCFDEV